MNTFCIVSERKVRDYLLNLDHPKGRAKAVFFLSLGFNRDKWAVLASALETHFITAVPRERESEEYGVRLECLAPLQTPSGRTPMVLSAWILRPGSKVPEFLSTYPS